MSDLIDRQAVKEWLARWEGYIDKDIIARMQCRVIDIPSAQSEHATCYLDSPCEYQNINIALPSAQLEIVLCKECKWYEGDIMGNPWGGGVCCHDGWTSGNIRHEVSESGWCYRAERREE